MLTCGWILTVSRPLRKSENMNTEDANLAN